MNIKRALVAAASLVMSMSALTAISATAASAESKYDPALQYSNVYVTVQVSYKMETMNHHKVPVSQFSTFAGANSSAAKYWACDSQTTRMTHDLTCVQSAYKGHDKHGFYVVLKTNPKIDMGLNSGSVCYAGINNYETMWCHRWYGKRVYTTTTVKNNGKTYKLYLASFSTAYYSHAVAQDSKSGIAYPVPTDVDTMK